MSDLIGLLIEFIVEIWSADSQIRTSRFGERSVAWLCGGSILFLLIVGLVWWLCTGEL